MNPRRKAYIVLSTLVCLVVGISIRYMSPPPFSVQSPKALSSSSRALPSPQEKYALNVPTQPGEQIDNASVFLSQLKVMEQPFGVKIPASSMDFVETHAYWFPAKLDDTSYQSNVSLESITPSLIRQVQTGTDNLRSLFQGTGRVVEVRSINGGQNNEEMRIVLENGTNIILFYRDLGKVLKMPTLVYFVGLPLGAVTLVDPASQSGNIPALLMDAVALTIAS